MLPFLKFPERIIVVEKASDMITPTHMTLAIKVPAGIDSWVLQLLTSIGVVFISVAKDLRVTAMSTV